MAFISVFGEGTVSGTGSGALTTDSADSSTNVVTGDTLQFDTGGKTLLDIDETVAVNDFGTTNLVETATTIDGNTIGPSNEVELNYAFLTQDASGDLFTVWVFAYGNSDADQFYLVSDAGTPTLNGFGEITTVTQTAAAYSGQELTVIDNASLSSGAITDPAMNDFMLGDGSLSFNPANNDLASAFGLQDFAPIVCFARGTMIEAEKGACPVETLQAGDFVCTKTSGLQAIQWIGSRKLNAFQLVAAPHLRPIRIKAGALGDGLPASDLSVSPQHRILVRSKIAQRIAGSNEVLVSAKSLLAIDGIDVDLTVSEVEYFHFLFRKHEIVWSNGAETESLYPGMEALNSVGPKAREEILALFPEFKQGEADHETPSAVPLLRGKRSRRLAFRHAKNCRALVA